ncbi:hypothetical protein O9G_000682 [Rozella allomycis CSF55]|uniref:CCDC66 domain-containing protein n=1 Tax=Rozella allomycis (strain CSF55) TaxID=988480 RepID=A0A075B2T5_ROZAC|nr:hypothetical protein O9G_000682 [Rozella allomycis CSF55]|eukprot:EPZ35286.1 hypothetical protein O9G_000682 [Rozella allomycis CSF55]
MELDVLKEKEFQIYDPWGKPGAGNPNRANFNRRSQFTSQLMKGPVEIFAQNDKRETFETSQIDPSNAISSPISPNSEDQAQIFHRGRSQIQDPEYRSKKEKQRIQNMEIQKVLQLQMKEKEDKKKMELERQRMEEEKELRRIENENRILQEAFLRESAKDKDKAQTKIEQNLNISVTENQNIETVLPSLNSNPITSQSTNEKSVIKPDSPINVQRDVNVKSAFRKINPITAKPLLRNPVTERIIPTFKISLPLSPEVNHDTKNMTLLFDQQNKPKSTELSVNYDKEQDFFSSKSKKLDSTSDFLPNYTK